MIFNYLVEMGFDTTGETCTCGAPIVMRGGWTGCWECFTSSELARRGRKLLTRLKLESALRDERSFWPEGMAL